MIREDLGFKGLLMSDDLSMKALDGGFAQRTRRSLRAGCDVVLHCNGDMSEMTQIAGAVKSLSGVARRRADAALARMPKTVEPLDVAEARARFTAVFGASAP